MTKAAISRSPSAVRAVPAAMRPVARTPDVPTVAVLPGSRRSELRRILPTLVDAADEIRRLRAKYPDKPLYVVVTDMCASGGYYIASAADKIFVDKASIVGSIGVLMDGFGFTGIMEKLGVERRAITAGENKRFLDPFAPLTAAHREYAEKMLAEIHLQFITVVRNGRAKRLKETPDVFSGLIWTGERSLELVPFLDPVCIAENLPELVARPQMPDQCVIENAGCHREEVACRFQRCARDEGIARRHAQERHAAGQSADVGRCAAEIRQG